MDGWHQYLTSSNICKGVSDEFRCTVYITGAPRFEKRIMTKDSNRYNDAWPIEIFVKGNKPYNYYRKDLKPALDITRHKTSHCTMKEKSNHLSYDASGLLTSSRWSCWKSHGSSNPRIGPEAHSLLPARNKV